MISVIIPVYNGAKELDRLLPALRRSEAVNEIVIIDAGSTDDSVKVAENYGVEIIKAEKRSFDHGKNRTLGGKKARGDILVYMTQDALPVNEDSIAKLVKPLLKEKEVGAAYGRQLPHHGATPFAAHLRAFNYPPESSVKSLKDRETLGIKALFISNTFAAYKKEALEKIGWFKEGIIMAEDVYAGAKLLMSGYNVAYAADALVYHSHNYTAFEELERYFDIGVFHSMESWILDEFGGPRSEGLRYIKSELRYLAKNRRLHLIPESILRITLKYAGYKLGNNYELSPKWLIKRLSMHADFWNKEPGEGSRGLGRSLMNNRVENNTTPQETLPAGIPATSSNEKA